MSHLEDDTSLVLRALRGDREAFESLVDRHLRPAFGIAFALTGSAHDSEDIVQDSFLRAFRRLASLERGNFGPWLGGIVRHVAADHRRSRARLDHLHKELRQRSAVADEGGPDGGTIERDDEARLVRDGLSTLPQELRLPLVLYYFEGQSTDRVAMRLGLRPATARKRLQLARDRLREQLHSKFEGTLARVSPRSRLRRSILGALAVAPFPSGGELMAVSTAPGKELVLHLVAGGTVLGMKKVTALLAATVLFFVGGSFLAVDPLGWRGGDQVLIPKTRTSLASLDRAAAASKPTFGKSQGASAPEIEAARGKAALHGVVLGTDGAAASHVLVTAYRLWPDGVTVIEGHSNLVSTRSDEHGGFRFEGIEKGSWALVAVAGRSNRATVPCVVTPSAAPILIRLEAGTTREGLVSDVEGRPLPGAEITISSLAPTWPLPHLFVRLNLISGEEGVFLLPGLPDGEYAISASDSEHWWEELHFTVPTRAAIEIHLKPAACVEGRIFLHDRSTPLRNRAVSIGIGASSFQVQVGPEGAFRSGPMQPGENTLVFWCSPFQPAKLPVHLSAAQPLRNVEIILQDGITVRGFISNKQGDALAGAELSWKQPGADKATRIECRADAAGRFVVGGLVPGTFVVDMRGFANADLRTTLVTVKDEEVQDLDLVMDNPAPIHIMVTNSTGTPATGVFVRASVSVPGMGGGDLRVDPTDSEGWTTVPGLSTEGMLALAAGDDGVGRATASVDLSQVAGPITLRLEPLGAIVGSVNNADGNTVAGATVVVSSEGNSRRVRANPEGGFSIRLPADEYVIEAAAGICGASRIEHVVVAPGIETKVLVSLDTLQTIRGRLVGPDGEPVASSYLGFNDGDPRVYLRAAASQKLREIEAVVDQAGWFAAVVDGGLYDVVSRASQLEQLGPAPRVVRGGPPVEIRLNNRAMRRVRGKVVDGVTPVEGVAVGWYCLPDFHSSDARVVSAPDGSFELDKIDADRIVVIGRFKAFALARSAEVVVPQCGTVEGVLVSVVEGSELEIRVKGADGQPTADAEIRLEVEDEIGVSMHGATDQDGVCRLRRVPAGEYQLQVQSVGRTKIKRQKLSWSADGTPIDVVLGNN